MNGDKRLRQEHQKEQEQTHSQTHQQGTAREFSSVEEMLRYDASQAAIPLGLEERLKRSIGREPRATTSWWKRFFFRK